jgi:hypothetical protein
MRKEEPNNALQATCEDARLSANVIPQEEMRTTRTQSVCEWIGASPAVPKPGSKVGIALGTLGKTPINGLRHPESGDMNGWYLWCGELSTADDFFSSLHVEHLSQYLPTILEYLELPPGYRFLVDGTNFEDVWFDQALLAV